MPGCRATSRFWARIFPAVTYSDLLSILLVSGYTAVEGSNYISVVPESIVRALPLPLATGKETFPDAQFVTAVVPVKNTMAAGLVPILRPLMPTHGHLAAMPCVNSLVLVDNFANVKRLEKVIASLDVGTPYVPRPCEGDAGASARECGGASLVRGAVGELEFLQQRAVARIALQA